MSAWSLVYESYEPAKEKLREALCTLGNGYFATRGAAHEAQADGIHYPGTYLAGGYNRLKTEVAGRDIENEDLVNMPNWLCLGFRINGGDWFKIDEVEIIDYRKELDLKRGVLYRNVEFKDAEARVTRIFGRRLVHAGNPHLAAQELIIEPVGWSGRIQVLSALDGRVINAGVDRYKELNSKHLQVLEKRVIDEETVFLKVHTSQSELRVAEAARTRIFNGDALIGKAVEDVEESEYVGQVYEVEAKAGEAIRIEKVVALYTSRDRAISECGLDAREAVTAAPDMAELMRTQALRWAQLWHRFGIDMEGVSPKQGEDVLRVLHLHMFHLLQTTSMISMGLDAGVPSRGWHGEAYRGHIFWDELFIFPTLNLRVPEITRGLLMYRYRRLPQARRAARREGLKGAMFPWQSGSNGREESQEVHLNPQSGRWIPDNSRRQRHVNAAIAYNVWQYYQVTGDKEFMFFYGAQMILEIAASWSSLAEYNQEIDKFEIHGVMGPDEYHDAYPGSDEAGLRNNAYTNIMAVWVLNCALEVLKLLPRVRREELCFELDLGQKDFDRWEEITRKMKIVFHDGNIISQFEGYDKLEEFDWEGYREKYGDIQRLDRILEKEGDTPNRYKLSKQADTLMLFYLLSAEELSALFERLGYEFSHDTIPRNIDYYIKRTSHGSTLSYVVHSWVLARSDRRRAWQMFRRVLQSDIQDIQGGTTPEGIHLGAMAGSLDLIQRAFLGIEARGDVLWFNPCLPEELERLGLQVCYRRNPIRVEISKKHLTISAMDGVSETVKIGFRKKVYDFNGGESRVFLL